MSLLRGFLTSLKQIFWRLRSEVSLPPDQLEAVFESLDTSQSGYITLEQFLAGINNMGRSDQAGEQSTKGSENDLSVQQLLGLNVLHKSGDLMCEVRSLMGSDTWHQLLAALFSDLNQLLRQISQLEDTLTARDHQHQEELRRLYEELENQLTDEREKLHKQLNKREASFRSELSLKEQQINELVEQRDQLQIRLEEAQRERVNTQKNVRRNTSNESHDKNERCCHEPSEECFRLQERTADLNRLAAEQSYIEGFNHAQYLAIMQEEGLLKQLKLLQEMQENLKSGVTPVKVRRKFSCDN